MKTILAIDDDLELLDNIQDILELEGYNALAASDGKKGIELAMTNEVDLILCDIAMPDTDGFDVIKVLKSYPDTFNIPFIFLSAKSAENDIKKGMKLGADDYVTKPFFNQDLINIIQHRLEQSSKYQDQYAFADLSFDFPGQNDLPKKIFENLYSIIGFSSILENQAEIISDHNQKNMLGRIKDSGCYLIRYVTLLNEYHNLQELKSKKPHFTNYKYQIAELVRKTALKVAKFYHKEDNIEIIGRSCHSTIPPKYIELLIYEITDNAFKFSTGKKKIYIETECLESGFRLEITNSGDRVDPTIISRIAPFSKFHTKHKYRYGLGLGLELVRLIVDIYKGILECEITIDNKTKFSVTFYS